MTEVFSIWAADINTTCLQGWDGARQSMGSRWKRRVCHWPRSAEPDPVRTTFSSASRRRKYPVAAATPARQLVHGKWGSHQ